MTGPPWIRWAVSIALTWAITSSLWIYPHSLSYFNELAGGPRHGHEFLLNSAIAWGQDLVFLRDWVESHPQARPLFVASMGYVTPDDLGIRYRLPPPGLTGRPPPRLEPGWYAIDVNHLEGSSEPVPDGQGGRFVPVLGQQDFTYFKRMTPVDYAGYSFPIYRVAPQE